MPNVYWPLAKYTTGALLGIRKASRLAGYEQLMRLREEEKSMSEVSQARTKKNVMEAASRLQRSLRWSIFVLHISLLRNLQFMG